MTKLEGDHDVFGDGSATILATPGHTPGHQTLLVKLPKTGAVLLTGDAVHFEGQELRCGASRTYLRRRKRSYGSITIRHRPTRSKTYLNFTSDGLRGGQVQGNAFPHFCHSTYQDRQSLPSAAPVC